MHSITTRLEGVAYRADEERLKERSPELEQGRQSRASSPGGLCLNGILNPPEEPLSVLVVERQPQLTVKLARGGHDLHGKGATIAMADGDIEVQVAVALGHTRAPTLRHIPQQSRTSCYAPVSTLANSRNWVYCPQAIGGAAP